MNNMNNINYTHYIVSARENQVEGQAKYLLDVKQDGNPVDEKVKSIGNGNIILRQNIGWDQDQNKCNISVIMPNNRSEKEESIDRLSSVVFNPVTGQDEYLPLILDTQLDIIDKKKSSSIKNDNINITKEQFEELQVNGNIASFLKESDNIVLDVTYKKYNYIIQSASLFQEFVCDLFALNESSKKYFKYNEQKNQIRLDLTQFLSQILSETDTVDNIPRNSFMFVLKALETSNEEEFVDWPILALLLAYIGADYLDYKVIKEKISPHISSKIIAKDLYHIISSEYIEKCKVNSQELIKILKEFSCFTDRCVEYFCSTISSISPIRLEEGKKDSIQKNEIGDIVSFISRCYRLQELYIYGYELDLQELMKKRSSPITINGFRLYQEAFDVNLEDSFVNPLKSFLFSLDIDPLNKQILKQSYMETVLFWDKNDTEISLQQRTNNSVVKIFSTSLEKSSFFIGECIPKNTRYFGYFLKEYPETWKHEITLEAIKNNPAAIKCAWEEITEVKVMLDLNDFPRNLQFASDRLSNDSEIVTVAMRRNPSFSLQLPTESSPN